MWAGTCPQKPCFPIDLGWDLEPAFKLWIIWRSLSLDVWGLISRKH